MALSTDPYAILLGHNRWATARILEHCRDMSLAQFHQRFDIGPGSLHDTLTHIIGAMLRWSDRIDGAALQPSIEGRRREVPALRSLLEEAGDRLALVVERARPRLADTREWTFGETTCRFTVAAAIIHVTNHGMHHRAQCMNMLKRLGHAINADLDELQWQVAGEP